MKRIILLKYRAIGDSIMGLGTVSYIKKLHPKAKVSYAVPHWIAPLIESCQTSADEIIRLDLSNPQGFIKAWSDFLNFKPDHIHELHQNGRSSKAIRFFDILSSNASSSYHNHHLKGGGPIIEQGLHLPLIQRDLDGVFSHFNPSGERPSFLDFEPVMKPLHTKSDYKKKIIFGVVATRETKMWSLDSYIELAKKIKRESPHLTILVPLSSSSVDLEIKAKLSRGGKDVFNFIERPLSSLASELYGADYYIGNDTGLKHLAVALGISTLTLFGPEPPLEWHPYNQAKHQYLYSEPLECRTRKAHYCALDKCDSMICLNEFTPEAVWEFVRERLGAF